MTKWLAHSEMLSNLIRADMIGHIRLKVWEKIGHQLDTHLRDSIRNTLKEELEDVNGNQEND